MLTKSEFKKYLDAPMHLWAKVNNQYHDPDNDFTQHIKQQGIDLEKYALEYINQHITDKFEYQRRFQTEARECIADVIYQEEGSTQYCIVEIKSSTDIKQVHEFDILFQYSIISKYLPISKIFILHVNKEYKREGELDLKEAFKLVDVTELINTKLKETEIKIDAAIKVQSSPSQVGIQTCNRPKDCPCPSLCFPKLPEYSIYHLANISDKRIDEFRSKGILDIKDINDNYPLSLRQRYQLISTKTQKPVLDRVGIQRFLSKLTDPLYFLDYEAYSWALPHFHGHIAYQNVVFQYSLHKRKTPSLPVEHYSFLSKTTDDPIEEVLDSLKKDIGTEGTILVWNKTFEMGCNKEMARIYPEYRSMMENINNRIIDLSELFSKQLYIDWRFKGSWSIKNILPIVVPELTYSQLSISNGTMAMRKWKHMVYKSNNLKEREQIYNDLLEYCKLDTYAMLRILEVIEKEVGAKLI